MKLVKTIILSVIMVSMVGFGCSANDNVDQDDTDPVLMPEDVFSQDILNQIYSHYDIGSNELEITYIGNHSYLFSTMARRVLIDSLTEIGGGYETTSGVILDMMARAEFPFNRISLALTTHIHGDHFDRDEAVNFLIANPDANHLSTIEVDESLQTSSSYNQIQTRTTGIFPDLNTRIQTQISGITVDVVRVDHHGSSGEGEHVAFLFTLNGIKILHVGDACKIPAQWDGLRLARENIDILIAPFGSDCSNWTLVSEDQNPFNIINWYIRPKHIIVSHLNFETTEAEIQTTVNLLQDELPGIGISYFHPIILKQKIYIKEGNTIRVIDKPVS